MSKDSDDPHSFSHFLTTVAGLLHTIWTTFYLADHTTSLTLTSTIISLTYDSNDNNVKGQWWSSVPHIPSPMSLVTSISYGLFCLSRLLSLSLISILLLSVSTMIFMTTSSKDNGDPHSFYLFLITYGSKAAIWLQDSETFQYSNILPVCDSRAPKHFNDPPMSLQPSHCCWH